MDTEKNDFNGQDVSNETGYGQQSEEQVYFNNEEYHDFEDTKKGGGKALSIIAFVLGAMSIMYICGGFPVASIISAVLGCTAGGISIARKCSAQGFAFAGVIVSALIAFADLYALIVDDGLFDFI